MLPDSMMTHTVTITPTGGSSATGPTTGASQGVPAIVQPTETQRRTTDGEDRMVDAVVFVQPGVDVKEGYGVAWTDPTGSHASTVVDVRPITQPGMGIGAGIDHLELEVKLDGR